MLKMKNLMENFDLARLALERWPHDTATLPDRLARFRISSNAVYPFDQGGRLCFLRLAPADEKRLSSVQAELEYLTWLNAQGYPAMKPLPSLSGALLEVLDTPWGVWYASAFACVPGVPVENAEVSPHIMQRYGEALGRLHALSAAYQPRQRRESHTDALAWIEEVLRQYHSPAHMQDICTCIRQSLTALPADRMTYGLVHYDFEPDNVFYSAEGDCCHVIDFDDSMYHFFILDIEQALDAMDEFASGDAGSHFLTGYQRHFPLPEDYQSQLPLMRDFCDLYAYARLLRCVSEKPAAMPDWMPGLCNRLKGRLHQLEMKFIR